MTQISHKTYLQMLFEQRMQTRNDGIPTTDISEWTTKVWQRERAQFLLSSLMSCSSLLYSTQEKAADSSSPCQTAVLLRSSTLVVWHSEQHSLEMKHMCELTEAHSLRLQIKSTSSNTTFSLRLQKPRLFWCYPEQFKITLWRLLLYAFLLSKALIFPVMQGTAWFESPSIHPPVFSPTSIRAAYLMGSLKEVI